jgi:hypothetical protein
MHDRWSAGIRGTNDFTSIGLELRSMTWGGVVACETPIKKWVVNELWRY